MLTMLFLIVTLCGLVRRCRRFGKNMLSPSGLQTRVPSEKLIASRLVKKLSFPYGTGKLITLLTRALCWSVFWVTWSTHPHTRLILRNILISSKLYFMCLASWVTWKIGRDWIRKQHVAPKRCYLPTSLHGVTPEKTTSSFSHPWECQISHA
jgi:hypothetical protein